ncbi:MAG: MFS transporter [Actinomycetota bacterium]
MTTTETGGEPEATSTGTPPSETSAGRGALAEPGFRRLWLTNIAFFLVVNAQRFAFGWVVLDLLLRDEGSQGMVVFALGAPTLLLVLHAGAWADRWNRKRMLVVTQLAGASVMALTAVFIDQGIVGPGGEVADRMLGEGSLGAPESFDTGYGWLLALTLLAGAATTIGHPVRSSLVPVLVKREQLFGAIALNAIAMTLSLILGPVLVRAAGETFGFDGAFWFLAALLGVGSLFLIRLDVPERPVAVERRSVLADTAEAVRHIWRDRHLRTLFGLLFMSSMTVNPAVMVTLQAHVKDEFDRSAGDAAIPFALMGVGIAISSVFVMRKGDMANKGAVFQRAMMCGSTVTFCTGLAPSFVAVVALAFLMGLAGGFFINMNQGLIQSSTPLELMGRTMGVYTLVAQGLFPLGALALGVAATTIGTGATISSAAAISLVIVIVTYVHNTELRRLG